MFPELPEPDRRALSQAPVNIVVFSIEFAAGAPWQPNSGLKWRAALRERGIDGRLIGVQQQQVSIQLTGGQPSAETVLRPGHQVTWSEAQTAAIYESAMILESRRYTTWDEYRAKLALFIDAAREVRSPEVLQSATLRYVNALTDDKAYSADFWLDKVNPAFLGPYINDSLRPHLQKGLYFLSFEKVSDLALEMRIGIQPDAVRQGRTAYVFDMEFSRREIDDFTSEAVLGAADRMNTAALQLFQQVVNDKYRQKLSAPEHKQKATVNR